ncbi:ABC transporter permease [Hymenobacter algoricola]|uniref:ABC transmembrane type-1 domain-containing protein n=1 Tax=Hymenobacter algoricola TaxID=486267 RepID=A0ABP7MIA1_9BACT
MKQPSYSTLVRWRLAQCWVALMLTVALLAPLLPLPYPPDAPDLFATTTAPFVGSHYLGTDLQGRDLLANLIFGARTALLVSLPAAALATLLGSMLGSVAGLWGNDSLRAPMPAVVAGIGMAVFALLFRATTTSTTLLAAAVAAVGLWGGTAALQRLGYRRSVTIPIDSMVLGSIALLASIPILILAIALAALYPPSLPSLLVVLVLTYWPGPARLIRAEILRIRALPYVEAGRALGLPAARLLWRHALPNCWHTIRASFPISVATLIGLETTLSFLGVGLPPETASWGRILASARLAPTAWWLILGPAVAIALTTLSLRQLTALYGSK